MKFTTPHFLSASCFVTVALLFAACSEKKEEPKVAPKRNSMSADGFVVKSEPFQSDYTASGTLLPNEEIQILPEVSGRVTSISFDEGKQVEKGKPLVKIYN